MRSRRITTLAVFCLLLAPACQVASDESQPLGEIHFVVNASVLRTSDALEVSLINSSSASAGYNLCFTSVEQSVGDQWVRSSAGSDQSCTKELRILEPGRSAVALLALGGSLGLGTYRVRTAIEWPVGEVQHDVVSDPFSVRP
jgi:hypothetical protein